MLNYHHKFLHNINVIYIYIHFIRIAKTYMKFDKFRTKHKGDYDALKDKRHEYIQLSCQQYVAIFFF